ncbi:MAG: helicase-associated domain-containing protein [Propionibacteriaceae bacterium]
MALTADAPARTSTDALWARPRAALVRLLQLRPDLRYPLPTGLSDLAARATTSTSVVRAVDALTSWQRLVCEGLAAAPDPVTVEDLATLLDRPLPAVTTAVAALDERALCWGGQQIHLVRAVRDAYGPYPGGLAPPSTAPLSPEAIDDALAASGDEARAVLDRLVWGPPTGAVRNADRVVTSERATSPVDRLLAHRLLRPLDTDTVVLPREVALRLREPRGLSRESVTWEPPPLEGRHRDPRLITRAGAGAAFALLHDADLVVATLESTPHRLLRAGGVSTRDVAALGRTLDQDPPYAAFLLELLAAGGLIGPGSRGTLLPTGGYDRWSSHPAVERWRALLAAWIGTDRWPALSAESGGHPLAPESAVARAAETRRLVLTEAFSVPAGTMLSLAELTDRVRWCRPSLDRSGLLLGTAVSWTWREAEWLGLAALGATTDLGVFALSDRPLDRALAVLFPDPGEHLIIQSDLTAVAPGPLTSAVLVDLRRLADQESRGAGGVFRFSAGSLRRAFDAGWSADQVHGWLVEHASTDIPQPLRYLVDDVARRHGSVRVGPALSYVRCDDPAQAASLLTHPDAVRLGLRLLAPGVLVSDAEPDEVVVLLRDIGLSPAAEDASGGLVTAPTERRARPVAEPATPQPPPAAEVADAILAADRRRPQRDPDADHRGSLRDTLRALEEATRSDAAVRVSYLSGDGTMSEADLSPFGLGAGMVRAVDQTNRSIVTIPLARISAVHPTGPDQ